MSLFTNNNRLPSAVAAPRFNAGASPMLRSMGSQRAPQLFVTSAESSDERLSTTMISSDLKDCERRLGKHTLRCFAPFQLTITTETLGSLMIAEPAYRF